MKLLGIDIGGTHTRIRLADPDASSHADDRLLTSEWLEDRGLDDPDAAGRLLARAYALGGHPSAPLVVGAHGCDTDSQVAGFHAAIMRTHRGPLLVMNDALLLAPAAGVEHAIGVIAGTGSIVVGSTSASRLVAAGGYGWIIGDPGSAPGITREGIKAVLDHHDQGLPDDALATRLMTHYGVEAVDDLAVTFLRRADIHSWAGAAPLVFEAANDGSALALAVIGAAARELAREVSFVLQRGALADAVVTAGGVVVHQPLLQEALADALLAQGIDLPLIVLEDDPVSGAIALAARISGVPVGSVPPQASQPVSG